MFFKLKHFNYNMLYLIKNFKKSNKRCIVKPFIWTKIIGFLKNSIYMTTCNKRKRLVRPHQGLIGFSVYYSLYHNKNATFRAKVEQKKKQKKQKEINKEKERQKNKNAWKEKTIKPKLKKIVFNTKKQNSLSALKASIDI